MGIIKEACVGSFLEAKKAFELGAQRIELCDNLKEGGTTPSYGTILLAKETLDLPINVMIRPRGGNFVYSEEEIRIMEKDIALCREARVNAVVIGALTVDHRIDEAVVKRLVEKAGDLEITFHMAFDEIEDKEEALEQLIACGIHRVLTKGGPGTALANRETIKALVKQAGDRIVILAGGGVTRENYEQLVEYTGVKEVHGTKIVGPLT
ncbi:copper homeostasis protein CutC [Capillibacterium thermochitinicola]|uniref:PF03932 family protein CutC n=1 Tax=Capillibacterium thermochitinicola TaxID=2699427 RepID=A0A8J6I3T6_9FIRM|nr:copper homeostasis protein CutC [Capillibacterium thermochitinicola]MBA2133964.1 copper homeostasis protein CutC [Capillibacterium thermochitinicola]